ncbi:MULTISPECIES: GNAT family N-acetyltransferase [Streptomyces]|uniref:GNAT family protein n=1 Tax=Streptomyces flaveolus TaxID=67297 RepID=A0ABV3AFG9_9ACTN|nr:MULTISPECIES: GNAT family protein [Streptomyces]KMS92054.1 GCN5 family acetyltransferase [Streptomyces regensis]KOG75935.1 GCN5 family acetyltransferase [Streptomyces antibioticus]KOX01825.1 GCN5 family acetyltransferase [Streptomyces sp. NRRL WC-3723]
MNEEIRIAGDEQDAEAERELSWRAKSLGLAALDIDDAELMHRWRSDPVAAHQIGIWPRSLTAVRERIERDIEDDDRDDFLVLLPGGTPVGYVALTSQNVVDGTAEIELMLAAQHRGHGHGTAALDAVVDLAFGELPMYRLTARTHTDNAPARAVLAKSGFTQEGISRAACLHRGRRHDLAVFSLLRPEWEELSRPRAWDA